MFRLGELWQFTREHAAGEHATLTYVGAREPLHGTAMLSAPGSE